MAKDEIFKVCCAENTIFIKFLLSLYYFILPIYDMVKERRNNDADCFAVAISLCMASPVVAFAGNVTLSDSVTQYKAV